MYSLITWGYSHRHSVSRWAYATTYTVGCLLKSGLPESVLSAVCAGAAASNIRQASGIATRVEQNRGITFLQVFPLRAGNFVIRVLQLSIECKATVTRKASQFPMETRRPVKGCSSPC